MADKKTKTASQDKGSVAVADLKNELRKALEQRAKLTFQHQTSPLKNPMELREVRREIARIKTYISQKEAAK